MTGNWKEVFFVEFEAQQSAKVRLSIDARDIEDIDAPRYVVKIGDGRPRFVKPDVFDRIAEAMFDSDGHGVAENLDCIRSNLYQLTPGARRD